MKVISDCTNGHHSKQTSLVAVGCYHGFFQTKIESKLAYEVSPIIEMFDKLN
jgi:hypothetical protein